MLGCGGGVGVLWMWDVGTRPLLQRGFGVAQQRNSKLWDALLPIPPIYQEWGNAHEPPQPEIPPRCRALSLSQIACRMLHRWSIPNMGTPPPPPGPRNDVPQHQEVGAAPTATPTAQPHSTDHKLKSQPPIPPPPKPSPTPSCPQPHCQPAPRRAPQQHSCKVPQGWERAGRQYRAYAASSQPDVC